MDEDRIGIVLARAAELRSKITNCIHVASNLQADGSAAEKNEVQEGENKEILSRDGEVGKEEQEDDEEAQSLLNIRDALEALEAQLYSLQALQQQQWYEKEAALAEIDYSRKKLLKKLKEYEGEDLEVIHEAAAFASETVEENNDLLLPPYPSRPSRSLVSDSRYLAHYSSTSKSAQNGLMSHDTKHEQKRYLNTSERDQVHSESKGPLKVVKMFISAATKTVVTVVGVITVLSLAGFQPQLKKKDTPFKVLSLFQPGETEVNGTTVQCPPGKVPLVENGETRCVVKERIEIPFESIIATPDVNFGCG